MSRAGTPTFDLPESLSDKKNPGLIAGDEVHFGTIAAVLRDAVGTLQDQLDEVRRAPAGIGTRALERDQEVRRLTSRLRLLSRYGVDLCLGRMVHEDGAVDYIGRMGLRDDAGQPLLIDWRAPAAEPFFAATHARPKGLVSRRRYRWAGGRVRDFWDEMFDDSALPDAVALDDQSSFLAGHAC
ncbi:hypothetical protein [Mariniluteicoccus flavus]